MPNYWDDVITEFQATIAAVWPDIGASFEIVQSKKINWYNLFKSKQIATRYVVWHIVDITQDNGEFGTANDIFRCHGRIYFFEKDSPVAGGGNVLNSLMGRGYSMQRYLWDTQFTTFRVLADALMVSAAEDEAANVMIEADMPLSACTVGFTFLVGECAPNI